MPRQHFTHGFEHFFLQYGALRLGLLLQMLFAAQSRSLARACIRSSDESESVNRFIFDVIDAFGRLFKISYGWAMCHTPPTPSPVMSPGF
jgi:hypothetical protein